MISSYTSSSLINESLYYENNDISKRNRSHHGVKQPENASEVAGSKRNEEQKELSTEVGLTWKLATI